MKKAAHDGGKGGTRTGGQNVPHLKTAESLAKVYGVTSRTIKRDGQFVDAVEDLKQADPTIEQRVHSGKVAKQSVVAGAKVLRPSSITQRIHASHASHLSIDRGRHGYAPPETMQQSHLDLGPQCHCHREPHLRRDIPQ